MIKLFRLIFLSTLLIAFNVNAQSCQESINELRQIQIVILKKTPAMPPLSKLLSPIQKGLQTAEDYRDVGDFINCINTASKITKIMQVYAQ